MTQKQPWKLDYKCSKSLLNCHFHFKILAFLQFFVSFLFGPTAWYPQGFVSPSAALVHSTSFFHKRLQS